MRKRVFVTVLILALVLTLTTAAAAFAATPGRGNYPGGGQGNQEDIQALAIATGQTTDQIQQDVSSGQTLSQIAQGVDQSTLAAAFQQVLTANVTTMATQMADRLQNSQASGQTGGATGSTRPSGGWQNGGGQTYGQQGGWQNGGQSGQANMMIQALAIATGQTTDQIQQDVSSGQTLSQIAQGVDQSTLAAAFQQVLTANIPQMATQMAERLQSGQMPGGTGENSTAAGTTSNSSGIVMTIGSSRMYVRGVAQAIDPGFQTSPAIVNGRTFVPIKAIIEQLGGTVDWNAADQTVTVTLNNESIVLHIGDTNATVNGVAKTLDAAPYISATNRTMLPVRFIAENFGHQVNWDGKTRTVTIQ